MLGKSIELENRTVGHQEFVFKDFFFIYLATFYEKLKHRFLLSIVAHIEHRNKKDDWVLKLTAQSFFILITYICT